MRTFQYKNKRLKSLLVEGGPFKDPEQQQLSQVSCFKQLSLRGQKTAGNHKYHGIFIYSLHFTCLCGFFSALFLGGQVNFGVVLFIIISSNSDMSHLGKITKFCSLTALWLLHEYLNCFR